MSAYISPYPARKDIKPDFTWCETCEFSMATRNFSAHAGGKKHQQRLKEARDRATLEADIKANGSTANGETLEDSQPTASGGGNGCFNCGKPGHFSKECTEPRKSGGGSGGFACHNCGQEGHKSRECTEPRKSNGGGGGGFACHNCGEEGHKSRECTEPRKPKCFNCDEVGHTKAECDKPRKPRDYSTMECNNCHQLGHPAYKCKNDPAEASDDFGAAFGGDSGFGNVGFGGAVAPSGDWEVGNADAAPQVAVEVMGDW